MKVENIFFPENLKALSVWVLWRIEMQNGRETKIPYSAKYNGRASSTNTRTWSTFEEARQKLEACQEQYNGLGVCMSPEHELIFIDVDHCLNEETGELDERATDILDAFGDSTYIEWSQSGKGLHILTFGTIPKNFKNQENGVEIYADKRFCAMTGNALQASEIDANASALRYVYERYKRPDRQAETHCKPSVRLQERDDKWIVDRATKRGGEFPLLFAGDWEHKYKSRSEADAALCTLLAFWTDANPEAIDRIFRSSGLYREKWERDGYRKATIENACSHIPETLSQYTERKKREEAEAFERDFLSDW